MFKFQKLLRFYNLNFHSNIITQDNLPDQLFDVNFNSFSEACLFETSNVLRLKTYAITVRRYDESYAH